MKCSILILQAVTPTEWSITVYYDITQAQHEQLLKSLNPTRVAKRTQSGKQLSYLETWDVKAHLNRIFGFTGWSWDVLTAECAFEGTVLSSKGTEQWNVGYKVLGCLRVAGASYSEAAVGSASLPSRGDAHDMAIKTAESDALKRAAINLGDQFGLSLYNNGSTKAVVGGTLYGPEQARQPIQAMQGALAALVEVPVEASVSDEEAPNLAEAPGLPSEGVEAPSDTEGAAEWASRFRDAMNVGDVHEVVAIKLAMQAADVSEWTFNGKTLAKIADIAVVEAGKRQAALTDLGATPVEEVSA
jgi:hypothetical protein